ncbi:MAG TPA: SGNH/GDSL hydrolase family protein [Planctomycetota bacterium]|nr:SGNH/GDSL hydrolase family protein [Planctomycetota bacterium]
MAGPGRSQLDRALRVAAILLTVVVLVLGATELLMRALFEPPSRPYTQRTLFGTTRTPDYRAFKISVDDGTPFEFVVNPLGFRGKSMRTAKKPPGVFRVFFVGASSTENQHLPEEKTFPGLVEQALAARGMKVEVANCGIAGQGVARSFSLIFHRLLELEPDLIVLEAGIDDMLASLDERWDPLAGPPGEPEGVRFKDWLLGRSRLVQVLDAPAEVDVRPLLEKRRRAAHARPLSVPPDLDLARGVPTFERYLHLVALACEDRGTKVSFLTQPALWKDECSPAELDALWMAGATRGPVRLDPRGCRKLLDAYDDATRRVARGRLLVDLAREVPRDLSCFHDDALLTARGNELVARAVMAELEKSGILK